MVVDTSAFVSILFDEHGADELAEKILGGPAIMASPNVLEAHLVVSRLHGPNAKTIVLESLTDLRIASVAFEPEHIAIAFHAFEQFGKGRHPAGLSFGDCIAYAVAKLAGQSLLFKGNDFSKTDIQAA